MPDVITYLVAAMTTWVPLHAHAEPKEETAARYDAIAHDAITVAYDESEAPLFGGPNGRAETALLMLSVASLESSYQKSVDQGTRKGDHGRSFCMMQIRVGDGVTSEGWSGFDSRDRSHEVFPRGTAHAPRQLRRLPQPAAGRLHERLRHRPLHGRRGAGAAARHAGARLLGHARGADADVVGRHAPRRAHARPRCCHPEWSRAQGALVEEETAPR